MAYQDEVVAVLKKCLQGNDVSSRVVVLELCCAGITTFSPCAGRAGLHMTCGLT